MINVKSLTLIPFFNPRANYDNDFTCLHFIKSVKDLFTNFSKSSQSIMTIIRRVLGKFFV